MRQLRTNIITPGKVEDRVNPYTLDGKTIHGVRWSGQNFYSLKEIIGLQNEGMINGNIYAFGRPLNVGDFVYTNVVVDDFIPTTSRGLFNGNLQENDVFIISNGEYEIIREDA